MALNKQGFKRVSDDKPIDISLIPRMTQASTIKMSLIRLKDSISA